LIVGVIRLLKDLHCNLCKGIYNPGLQLLATGCNAHKNSSSQQSHLKRIYITHDAVDMMHMHLSLLGV